NRTDKHMMNQLRSKSRPFVSHLAGKRCYPSRTLAELGFPPGGVGTPAPVPAWLGHGEDVGQKFHVRQSLRCVFPSPA
ncbi:MAG: hypothetical protein ACRD2L_21025, partial [Terriglobia bacterium]